MLPLVAAGLIGTSKAGLGKGLLDKIVGKRQHTSYTFTDIYGRIQHTETKAEADAFLAAQKLRKATNTQWSSEPKPSKFSSEAVAADLGKKAGIFGIATLAGIGVIVWLFLRK